MSEAPVEAEGYFEAAEDFAEQAQAVERLAQQRFGGGVYVAGIGEGESLDAGASQTAALMADPQVPAIFQGAFVAKNAVGVVDVLQPAPGGWILYEVKASSKLKNIFLWDLAFQWLLLEECGHHVVQAKVLYLNKQYAYPGGEPDPGQLLTEEDCTAQVQQLLNRTREEIAAQLTIIELLEPPAESPGRRCRAHRDSKEGNRPSDCGHLAESGCCGQRLPANWSLRLHRLTGAQLTELTARQLHQIEDLVEDDAAFSWNPLQVRIIRATRNQRAEVDREALQRLLGELQWPLAFIDFKYEPAVAVPRFVGMRPNQRLPFQWSMGVWRAPMEPVESISPFLHGTPGDPRRPFIESLIAALPDAGSVVTHFRGAEEGVLNLFVEWFPGEYDGQIAAIRARLFDSCRLAQEAYYHPSMQCSFSLKKLAPALVGLGYGDLAIQDGMAAVRRWRQLIVSDADRESVEGELVAYCGRDTELMSGVVREFLRLAGL